MNILVHVVSICFLFLGYLPRSEIAGLRVHICLALVALSISSLKLYISIPFMHEAYLFERF